MGHDNTGMNSFQREQLTESMVSEVMPLLEQHWREIAHDLTIPLSVDWERYFMMQANDAFRVFTVRRSGELIGYAAFFVHPNMHYSTSLQAVQDVIFIREDMRRGSLGSRLIRFAEEELKREGVQLVLHHIKAKHNWGALLERMGYTLVDLIYAKRIN